MARAVPGAQGQANPLAQGLTEGGGAALVPADPEGAEAKIANGTPGHQ